MEVKTKVYEIQKIFKRVCEEKEEQKIIFEFNGNEWVFHAPNAIDFTEEQLEITLKELKELNKNKPEKEEKE